MPKPKAGESREDFVQRCIPMVMNDGSAKDNKQAVAMCYSMYDQKKSVGDSVVKMMGMEMSGQEYAHQEAWDISTAANVLSYVAQMCQNEIDEPDDIQSLANIMRSLMEFINGEIQEMVNAAKQGESYEKHYAQVKEKIDLSYVKSLGVENATKGLAVKFVAKDEIKGYTFLWGNSQLTDVEIEYFTPDTNFWDAKLGKSARPLTWDHAQDEDFKASPIIGEITDFGDDELGRWYVAKLDTAHRYRKMIDALIKDGVIGTSSDSAPQYVQRVKTGKSTWLKEWPWFASALTNTPCEPRMIGSLEFLKSLGIALPDAPEEWEADMAILDYYKTIYKLGE